MPEIPKMSEKANNVKKTRGAERAENAKKPRKLGMPTRPKIVKTRKSLNKNKKIQKCPKSHFCQGHQKTANKAEESKLAMKLKKIRKAKKTQRLIERKTPKNANKISDPKRAKKTKKNYN